MRIWMGVSVDDYYPFDQPSPRSNQRCRSCPVEFRLKKRNNFGFRDRQKRSYNQARLLLFMCRLVLKTINWYQPAKISLRHLSKCRVVYKECCKNSVNLFADEKVTTTCTSLLYWQVLIYVLTTFDQHYKFCVHTYMQFSPQLLSPGSVDDPNISWQRKHWWSVVANCLNQEASKFL